jgi:LysM domain-containing protein
MAPRSPARFLAPLALVAFGIALFMVVTSSSTDPETGNDGGRSSEEQPAASPGNGDGEEDGGERKGRRRYTVRPGDTPSSIAEKTGVPLEDILRLNPDLDPQTLSPGQRIKLRQ